MNYKTFLIVFSLISKFASSAVADPDVPSYPISSDSKTYHKNCADGGCSGVFVNTFKLRLIFDWWLCDKSWQYALTLVGLFGFGAISPCLKAYREILRSKVIKSYVFDCVLTHFLLFLFAMLVYMLDFALMLIVMSFNVGVFFAVTSGYALGYVLSSLAYAKHMLNNRSRAFSQANEDCC